MPVERMRMRPWLVEQINSSLIPGLIWINREKRIFQIPWMHAARHGWDLEKDAPLFMNWAIHTGKYQLGIDKPDPKTWKANFRCAMNSLPDIEEVKDKSIKKGTNAFRVYKMLSASERQTKKGNLHLWFTNSELLGKQQVYTNSELLGKQQSYTAQCLKHSEELLANAGNCLRLLYQISNHRHNYNIIMHRNTSLRSLIWSNPETIILKTKPTTLPGVYYGSPLVLPRQQLLFLGTKHIKTLTLHLKQNIKHPGYDQLIVDDLPCVCQTIEVTTENEEQSVSSSHPYPLQISPVSSYGESDPDSVHSEEDSKEDLRGGLWESSFTSSVLRVPSCSLPSMATFVTGGKVTNFKVTSTRDPMPLISYSNSPWTRDMPAAQHPPSEQASSSQASAAETRASVIMKTSDVSSVKTC
ncbi:unnamed protein product [Oncorhynchus mykiss]|uniref:IRF tryptophan pentad repeat domain-containing protein n=1 Tax=Oncorhynchus mykiss TaxID=8022 RepID=A0A060XX53_ONCMY|nr:unnamed protein product [Oncorhynchus mykiss]